MTSQRFGAWVEQQLQLDQDDPALRPVLPAFEILTSRIDDARRRGARDPYTTVTAKTAGGNSRACTRRMLEQLRLPVPARRAVHRLLAGSPSGWPGLTWLYATNTDLSRQQREYCRRQLQSVREPGTDSRTV